MDPTIAGAPAAGQTSDGYFQHHRAKHKTSNSRFDSQCIHNGSSHRPYGLMRRNSMAITDTNASEPFRVPSKGPIEDQKPKSIRPLRIQWHDLKLKYNSSRFRPVLKCALTYALCSLATYNHSISGLYGRVDSKHMICTVTVYFPPARSVGAMIESIMYVVISLGFALLVALTSMFVSNLLVAMHLSLCGSLVVLISSCFGVGCVAYAREKAQSFNFNTASSLACMYLMWLMLSETELAVTTQFGIVQVLRGMAYVWTGVTIATILCVSIWPKYAIDESQATLKEYLKSVGKVVRVISHGFQSVEHLETCEYIDLFGEPRAALLRLEHILPYARNELYLLGRESEYPELSGIVEVARRLSSLVGALRSSSQIHWSLLQPLDEESAIDDDIASDCFTSDTASDSTTKSSNTGHHKRQKQLYDCFMEAMGDEIRSYTCLIETCLNDLHSSSLGDAKQSPEFEGSGILKQATAHFSASRERALRSMYAQDLDDHQQSSFPDIETLAHYEGVAACCGNFSYCLEDLGSEVLRISEAITRWHSTRDVRLRRRTYSWLKPTWSSSWSADLKRGNSPRNFFDSQSLSKFLATVARSNAPAQTPRGESTRSKLYKRLRCFRRTDVQYGFKVGFGALLFAIPFLSATFAKPMSNWRVDWGLTTYTIIMTKSLGGTALSVKLRFLGTFLGIGTFLVFWSITSHPVFLVIGGFVLSLACFHIILNWNRNNAFGRYILLTYNIASLYSYSLSVNDPLPDGTRRPVDTLQIGIQRFFAVTMAVIWALIMTTVILPNSARRRVRHNFSVLWLQMGLLWKADPLQNQPRKQSLKYQFVGIPGDEALSRSLNQLENLLSQAPAEFRLKGPYPIEEYQSLLISSRNILNAFRNITVLITKDPVASSQELEILKATRKDRLEIMNRCFIFFYLAASALTLGFPLPERLPSSDHAINRMLVTLHGLRLQCWQASTQDCEIDPNDFVLFYSYVLNSVAITEELSKIALQIQRLFGIIEVDAFDVY